MCKGECQEKEREKERETACLREGKRYSQTHNIDTTVAVNAR